MPLNLFTRALVSGALLRSVLPTVTTRPAPVAAYPEAPGCYYLQHRP
jgi:hypothetical protein